MNRTTIIDCFSECFKESETIANKISYDYSEKKFEMVCEKYVFIQYTQYGFFAKVRFDGSIDVVIFKNIDYKQEIERLRNHIKDDKTPEDALMCFIPFSGILLLQNINDYKFDTQKVKDELATINNVDVNNLEMVVILDRLKQMFSILKEKIKEDDRKSY